MQKTNLVSIGAILFYLLIGLVIFMIAMLMRQGRRKPPDSQPALLEVPMPEPNCTGMSASPQGRISILRSAGEGGTPLLDTTTMACGEQELEFNVHPRKILVEHPCTIIDESGFGTALNLDGNRLTIRRFSDKGIIVDDHGSKIHIRVYALEWYKSSPGTVKSVTS